MAMDVLNKALTVVAVVFATDKQIIAFLIKGHPVASAVEIFFAAGSKRLAKFLLASASIKRSESG